MWQSFLESLFCFVVLFIVMLAQYDLAVASEELWKSHNVGLLYSPILKLLWPS